MPAERDTPITTALASLSGRELLQFLMKQRWFGAKGAAPTDAQIANAIVMPWGGGRFATARVVVHAGGAEHVYQLPLATADVPPPDVSARFIVGASQVRSWGGSVVVVPLTPGQSTTNIIRTLRGQP